MLVSGEAALQRFDRLNAANCCHERSLPGPLLTVKRLHVPPEGSVFLVPLSNGQYAIGVLVRANGEGGAYGLFFGPPTDGPQHLDVQALTPETALLRCKFGDFGLVRGRWRVIGRIDRWEQTRWPLPLFSRGHDDPSLRFVSEYNDALQLRSEKILQAADAQNLPEDAQFGSGVVETKLSRLLL
jgi:hypothetical protein